jgi:hypothetical protein
MADKLNWFTITAFPGVDVSTTDHLLQPRRLGPVAMRRMLSADPFVERGKFQPAAGYAKWDDWTGGIQTRQGIFAHVNSSSTTFFRVDSGVLSYLSGGSWTNVVSSHLPLHGTNRVRFATGYNALFICDGADRPKVYGWNYIVGDTTLAWDTEQHLAEIKYTRGQKSTPDDTSDDFYAEGCCFHMERLVLWKGQEVRFSAPFLPTTFYDPDNAAVGNSFLLAGGGDGSDVTMCLSFEGQMLVVGKPYSLHGYIGEDPATSYSHIVLDNARGIYAADSAAMGGGRLYFCAYDGPCVLDTKKGVEYIGDAIRELWGGLTYAQKAAVVGWWEDNLYHIILPVQYTDAPQTLPAMAYIRLSYDPLTKRWSQGYGVHGLPCLAMPADQEQFALVQYTDGDIYRQNTGTTLAGTTITHELITPWFTFGEPWRDKWIRMLSLELEQSAETIDLAIGTDYKDGYSELTLKGKEPDILWWSSTLGPADSPPMNEPDAYWLRAGDIDCAVWNTPGRYTIELPRSVHCKTMRLRIRGDGLVLRSIGVGYAYEGT